jgi:hypothetical protein
MTPRRLWRRPSAAELEPGRIERTARLRRWDQSLTCPTLRVVARKRPRATPCRFEVWRRPAAIGWKPRGRRLGPTGRRTRPRSVPAFARAPCTVTPPAANRRPSLPTPAPAVTRAAWRTAARGTAPPIIPPEQCRARSAYNSGSAKQRRTNRPCLRAPRRLSKGGLPAPRHFTSPRIVCCSRQPARPPAPGQPPTTPTPHRPEAPAARLKVCANASWLLEAPHQRGHAGCFHLRPRSRRARPQSQRCAGVTSAGCRMLRLTPSPQGRERRSSAPPATSAEPRQRPAFAHAVVTPRAAFLPAVSVFGGSPGSDAGKGSLLESRSWQRA